MERLFGLFLLHWMATRVSGQHAMDSFINDLVTTFQLSSPTIIYENEDEIPEICYDSQWVLCLPSIQHEIDMNELPDDPESYRESQNDGMHVKYNLLLP